MKNEDEINRVIDELNELLVEGGLNPVAYAETEGAVNMAMWVLGEHDEFDEYLE